MTNISVFCVTNKETKVTCDNDNVLEIDNIKFLLDLSSANKIVDEISKMFDTSYTELEKKIEELQNKIEEMEI